MASGGEVLTQCPD